MVSCVSFLTTLDTFKIQLDRVLGHLAQNILLPRKVGSHDPLGPFQPGVLCFYDYGYNVSLFMNSMDLQNTQGHMYCEAL